MTLPEVKREFIPAIIYQYQNHLVPSAHGLSRGEIFAGMLQPLCWSQIGYHLSDAAIGRWMKALSQEVEASEELRAALQPGETVIKRPGIDYLKQAMRQLKSEL